MRPLRFLQAGSSLPRSQPQNRLRPALGSCTEWLAPTGPSLSEAVLLPRNTPGRHLDERCFGAAGPPRVVAARTLHLELRQVGPWRHEGPGLGLRDPLKASRLRFVPRPSVDSRGRGAVGQGRRRSNCSGVQTTRSMALVVLNDSPECLALSSAITL